MASSKTNKLVGLIILTGICALSFKKNDIYSKKDIKYTMQKVFAWQVEHPVKVNLSEDWARAALYIGATRAYNVIHNDVYLNAAIKYADSVNWKPGKRPRHADDLTRGQVFLDLYAIKKQNKMLEPIKNRIDSLIVEIKPGRVDWWWCDALFMEPPLLVRLANQTGDEKYLTYLDQMWWDTTDYLFDKNEGLYFRDQSYFKQKTPSGKKVFWSRGNGWVLAGLAQVIEWLPTTNPSYPKYVDLYKTMAAKIGGLQQPDGFWRTSLLDPGQVSGKETSGTGFFTFALAWGINQRLLNREAYLPIVKRGWGALSSAINDEGKLQWVQQIGAEPNAVKQDDNQEYGTGAYLMAGAEMLKLNCATGK
ncbi:glycoside hydrolase family 88/105 protein [Mucilaginibacter sp. FT3.2]|uniref:glycoside hydrolase family 88/105 protein n=1 Tax=Mucilaginibacter sp. FT3.2 TaxID=2723090 RepID=UPI00161C213E|nr:glycoside hydrolase family 88 protein [Mucilaginibacter sp. FT3.2]MBB6234937.1 rhamnogalacturonyl hydrolase YesR [Mucilaginibacter sp. FT3.2]